MDDPFSEIEQYRQAWETYVGLVEQPFATPSEAARHFGLHPNDYMECGRDRAILILSYLLQYDLAHGSDCMTQSQAQAAIQLLMSRFSTDARFFTNGDWDNRSTYSERHCSSGTSWQSGTNCTFDGGILVLASDCTACIWFGDED